MNSCLHKGKIGEGGGWLRNLVFRYLVSLYKIVEVLKLNATSDGSASGSRSLKLLLLWDAQKEEGRLVGRGEGVPKQSAFIVQGREPYNRVPAFFSSPRQQQQLGEAGQKAVC